MKKLVMLVATVAMVLCNQVFAQKKTFIPNEETVKKYFCDFVPNSNLGDDGVPKCSNASADDIVLETDDYWWIVTSPMAEKNRRITMGTTSTEKGCVIPPGTPYTAKKDTEEEVSVKPCYNCIKKMVRMEVSETSQVEEKKEESSSSAATSTVNNNYYGSEKNSSSGIHTYEEGQIARQDFIKEMDQIADIDIKKAKAYSEIKINEWNAYIKGVSDLMEVQGDILIDVLREQCNCNNGSNLSGNVVTSGTGTNVLDLTGGQQATSVVQATPQVKTALQKFGVALGHLADFTLIGLNAQQTAHLRRHNHNEIDWDFNNGNTTEQEVEIPWDFNNGTGTGTQNQNRNQNNAWKSNTGKNNAWKSNTGSAW